MSDRETTHELERPVNHEDASPRELERQIDRTRLRLENSIQNLERRLTPEQLIRQFASPLQEGGKDFVENLASQARHNPMPVVLVATGLAWLMGSSLRDRDAYYDSSRRFAGSDHDSESGFGSKARELKEAAASKIDSMTEAARDMQTEAADRLKSAKEGVSSSAENVSARASKLSRSGREGLSSARDGINSRLRDGRDMADRVADRTAALYREQPVALGIAGLALGAIVGALLPPTRREDELLGEHRDQLKNQAEQTLSTQYESAKQLAVDKAQEISDKALQTIDKQKNE